MVLERHIPVCLEEFEAAALLGRVALLIREEACRDLRLGVVLDRRPISVDDRDEEVPVRPAVAVEPGRGGTNVEEPAGRQLLPQDRPVVALEQLDELVERTQRTR